MDQKSTDSQAVNISIRLYRLLVMAYPAIFRREYGKDMLQVFRDCCRRSYQDGGSLTLLALWARTIFDWFKTVLEEQLNRGTEMTRKKFIRLSGWALILAAVALVAGFGIGGGETSYNDPLGGFDGFYEYSQLILIPASLFLYTVGMLGLRLRYGDTSGTLGKFGLFVAVVAGALSFICSIPLFALMAPWIGEWWNLTVYGMLVMLTGLALFGLAALRSKPLPRWNALPLLTAVWFPLLFVIAWSFGLLGDDSNGLSDFMALVSVLFMVVGSVLLGYILQKDPHVSNPDSAIQV